MIYRCPTFGNIVEGEDVPFGGSCGGTEGDVAALDHKAGHEAVEGGVIICAACAEGEKVLGVISHYDILQLQSDSRRYSLLLSGERFRKKFRP